MHYRNRKFVFQQLPSSGPRLAGEIVAWATLPPGRTEEKPWCGLLLRWWQEECDDRPPWSEVFESLAAGTALTTSWMATHLLDGASVNDLERAWADWLTTSAKWAQPMGSLDMDSLIAFKKLLRIDFRAFSLPPAEGLPWQVGPEVMLEQRYEPWVSVVAPPKASEMQRVLATGSRELGAVAQFYHEYFLGLVSRGRQQAPTDKALRLLLQQAEQGLALLEKDVALRHNVIEHVNRAQNDVEPTETTATTNNLLDLRRRFLDEVEGH
jgi:hypothetical protein